MSFVKFENVYKRYKMGEITINAADGVSFEIEKGEFAVIVGASGAGKTTILNMLGGMDTCDEGKILVDGKDIATFNKKQLTTYRRYDIGFVFQFYNLVNNLTAKENVELATQICAHASQPEEVLKKVGLEDRMNNFPSFRAASSSVFLSHEHWRKILSFFFATNQRALLITTQVKISSDFCRIPAAVTELQL